MARGGHAEVHRDAMVAGETQIDLHQFHETPRHQPRADDQHDSQRDLGHDERVPQPAGCARTATPSLAPRILKLGRRRADRRINQKTQRP